MIWFFAIIHSQLAQGVGNARLVGPRTHQPQRQDGILRHLCACVWGMKTEQINRTMHDEMSIGQSKKDTSEPNNNQTEGK
jgi:hypothetical protein